MCPSSGTIFTSDGQEIAWLCFDVSKTNATQSEQRRLIKLHYSSERVDALLSVNKSRKEKERVSVSMENRSNARERCTADSSGSSAFDIFCEFLMQESLSENKHDQYARMIDLFGTMQSDNEGENWNDYCKGCSCWELDIPKNDEFPGETAYTTTHGIKAIVDNIPAFCSYFIIRKCLDDKDKKLAYSCMKELVKFCQTNCYIDGNESKRIQEQLAPAASFPGLKIVDELYALYAADYWTTLEETTDADEGNDSGGDRKKQKTDAGATGVSKWEKTLESELGWTALSVVKDGWLFDRPSDSYVNHEGTHSDSEFRETLLIRLPAKVAKLGKPGMRLSCMGVRLRNGIWHPYGLYGNDYMPCANAYPP